jgi:hypothetical protein
VIKSNELDRACTGIGEGKVHTGLWWEDQRESEHMENLNADRRIILK